MSAVMTVGSNLQNVGMVIGGCNLVGFMASAAFETHKITDLVGVGSFVTAAVSLSLRNPAIFNRMKVGSQSSKTPAYRVLDCTELSHSLSLQLHRLTVENAEAHPHVAGDVVRRHHPRHSRR